MTKWRRLKGLTWLPMVLLLAVGLACGNGAATGGDEADSGGMDPVKISLNELNESGQSGTATLTASGGGTQVTLSLGAGTMKSKLVHIHNGQCGADLGGVANGLTDFTDGNSDSMLADVSLESLLTGGFAINAHKAEDPSVYTACGNIPKS